MSDAQPAQPDDLPNVLRLYEELGVRPDQGVESLTARYRQRVRAIHPDLRAGADTDGNDLGWLTRSYREAVAFERRHGRLPGASARPAAVPAAAQRGASWPRAAVLRARNRRSRGAGGRWRWILAGGALATVLLVGAGEVRERWLLAGRAMEPVATIGVGSTEHEVLRIEGAPLRRDGARWHYGASWIEFDDGRVVRWHSATVRPLQVHDQGQAR